MVPNKVKLNKKQSKTRVNITCNKITFKRVGEGGRGYTDLDAIGQILLILIQ